jgi:hypothetical protein
MTVPDTSDTPTPAAVMLERTRRRARQIRRRRRAGLASALVFVAAVAVGISVLVTGGSSPSRQLRVAAGPPTTASRPTITPTTPSGGASGGGSGSSTPVTTATAPPSPGPQPCATSQLTAGLTGGNGTAGAIGYQLELRNTSPTACTLRGYPGVSYVTGGNGTTVGAPATRSGSAGSTITLAPGQAAQAPLLETDSLNYPQSTCRLNSVDGLRVYPPDQRAALFIAQAGRACANPADNVLQVGPLQPAQA